MAKHAKHAAQHAAHASRDTKDSVLPDTKGASSLIYWRELRKRANMSILGAFVITILVAIYELVELQAEIPTPTELVAGLCFVWICTLGLLWLLDWVATRQQLHMALRGLIVVAICCVVAFLYSLVPVFIYLIAGLICAGFQIRELVVAHKLKKQLFAS